MISAMIYMLRTSHQGNFDHIILPAAGQSTQVYFQRKYFH